MVRMCELASPRVQVNKKRYALAWTASAILLYRCELARGEFDYMAFNTGIASIILIVYQHGCGSAESMVVDLEKPGAETTRDRTFVLKSEPFLR